MYDKDPNQKTRAPRRGEPITSADMQKIVALILQTVKGGRGILIKRVGQSIIVEAEQGRAVGGSGSSAFHSWCKVAPTKAELEEPVAEIYFGRVTAGDDIGMMCVRNPDNDGWNSFTHFE